MNTKIVIVLLMVPCTIYGVGSEDINELGRLMKVERRAQVDKKRIENLLENVEQKEAECLKFLTETPTGGAKEVSTFYNAVVAYKEAVIAERNASIKATAIVAGLLGVLVTRMYYWSMNCQ